MMLLLAGAGALNAFAVALVLLRAAVYRVPVYRPMLLNVVLSLAPAIVLAATFALLMLVAQLDLPPIALRLVAVAGGLVWLLLLPNSAYLITELNFSHRRMDDPVPLWFDIVGTLALALSGIDNTVLNVLLAQAVFFALRDDGLSGMKVDGDTWVVAAVILLLVSFGIYLGRHIRFNSWDLVRPTRFVTILVRHFRQRGRVTEAAGFCALHTILLGILYAMIALPLAAAL
ncbi:DUF1361 domain-containing protein [Microbacterium sp. p3-SID336]|uniref:DUF1361 domain-containing protein n=1 Tax=Microbacterium sp. p3-SID336 TaxID=2916212 RepID=UPI0021A7EFFA|nr:DUF1361 domain-containing protein [Microbacterium sp. p3-SID336]MCT1479169.1 DUF1361 domain-containing protein [Microbacterium sp. p3-SID336]